MPASSATRVLTVYNRLLQRNDEKVVGAAWAAVFGVPEGHPQSEDWTMEATIAFRSEVDRTRRSLQGIGVPLAALGPVFQRLKDAANPAVFPHSWESQKKAIGTPEHALVLEWAVWALRDQEEQEVADEQFGTIGLRLGELEAELSSTEMPPALRAFIQKQVDEIREAIRLYPIIGVSILNRAVESATGAFTVPSDAVVAEVKQASPEQKKVLTKALGLLKTTAEATGHVEKLADALKAISNYASEVGPAIKAIGASLFK